MTFRSSCATTSSMDMPGGCSHGGAAWATAPVLVVGPAGAMPAAGVATDVRGRTAATRHSLAAGAIVQFIIFALLLGALLVGPLQGATPNADTAVAALPPAPGGKDAIDLKAERQASASQMELLDNQRKLQVGDRLVYEVLEEREDPVILFVDDKGMVNVPLLGNVPAQGKTARDLAYELKKALEIDYFYQATVMVRYQYGQNSRGRVTLVGQVRSQGPLAIPADEVLTVSGAILRAGGILPGGDGARVTLTRKDPSNPDGEKQTLLDVTKMLESGDFSQDVPVQADDLIVVPKSADAGGQIYVLGAVNQPGLYDISQEHDFTLSKAILKAGGFTRFSDKAHVKLIRADKTLPEGQRTLIVNVADILERGKRDKDVVVKPDDIIRVEERTIVW